MQCTKNVYEISFTLLIYFNITSGDVDPEGEEHHGDAPREPAHRKAHRHDRRHGQALPLGARQQHHLAISGSAA